MNKHIRILKKKINYKNKIVDEIEHANEEDNTPLDFERRIEKNDR